MKETMDQSTRALNECRAEVTSLKLELDGLMASRAHGTPLKPDSVPIAAQTETSKIESEPESETTVSENGVIAENREPLAEITGTSEEASIVEEILADIVEISTSLVVSNGIKTGFEGDQECREDVVDFEEVDNHQGLKEFEKRQEQVHLFPWSRGCLLQL